MTVRTTSQLGKFDRRITVRIPWLESCKNPTAIRRLSTPWAHIRRRSGKFNRQLKFAGWSADSWGNYAICRRPPGCRPNIWRWPVGHRPIFLGKIRPKIGRSPPVHRGIIPRWSHGDRTVTQGWSAGSLDKESHLTVTARWPHGHLQASAGRPLDTLILSAVISIWRDCWDVMKTTMGYKN